MPSSRRVRDSRWWGSLTMALAENKAKHLLSVNHTRKTIDYHHHRHHHHQVPPYFTGKTLCHCSTGKSWHEVHWNLLTCWSLQKWGLNHNKSVQWGIGGTLLLQHGEFPNTNCEGWKISNFVLLTLWGILKITRGTHQS